MPYNAQTGEQLTWEKLGWGAAASVAAWQEAVVGAIRAFFEQGRPQLLEPTALIDVRSDFADGVPVVVVVYDHPYSAKRLGLRVRLDDPPGDGVLAMAVGGTAAEVLADYVASIAISEPLGTGTYHLVDGDNGVQWWGYGYPVPFL